MTKVLPHYRTLEVSPRASQPVIKAAYRELARLHHPYQGGKGIDLVKLNEAYEILSDPAKRRAYDATGETDATGTIIGNYRVLAEIAEGGFGTTYKGEHILTGEPVCIKHCSQVSAAHDAVLVNETKVMWDLRHHAVPAVRDLIRLEDDTLALVMSYIPGPTLLQIVEKVGKLDPEKHVAWIIERVLNALLYLHHHGVVHGDLKPGNIIVQPDIHATVLVDFGLSVVKPTGKTKAAGFTPFFAPPEQIAERPLLPESDFYSLGMCIIYALSGNMKAVERVQVPTGIPDALCQFIRSLIQHDVLSRPRGDLFELYRDVRIKSFGTARSGMAPIPGF